jgi:hypothetical protein
MKPQNHMTCTHLCVLILSALMLPVSGCWDAGLPGEMPVPLPDGSTVTASAQGGPPSMAQSQWSVYTDFEPTSLLLRLEFDENGDVARVYDNTVYSDVVGQELIPDGRSQPSPWPGGSYVAQCYVAEKDAYLGFVCLGNANVGPLRFGTISLTVSGTRTGDRIEGSLELTVDVDPAFVGLLPFTPGLYEQGIIAVPVGAEPPETAKGSWLADNVRPDALAIELEVPASGSLVSPGDEDWFTFTLDQSLPVAIETSGSQGDTVLWLYDVNMSQIGFNDDNGESLLSRIETAALPAGVYYVRVQGFQGQVVDPYTLTVSWLFYY